MPVAVAAADYYSHRHNLRPPPVVTCRQPHHPSHQQVSSLAPMHHDNSRKHSRLAALAALPGYFGHLWPPQSPLASTGAPSHPHHTMEAINSFSPTRKSHQHLCSRVEKWLKKKKKTHLIFISFEF